MTDDPFVTWIQSMASAMSNAKAAGQQIWTLGRLHTELQNVPGDTPVVVRDDMKPPTQLCSYRGYYERLGISTEPNVRWTGEAYEVVPVADNKIIGESGYDHKYSYSYGVDRLMIAQPCTANILVNALEMADGTSFDGYKGGSFLMDEGSYLHVAPEGSTGTCVIGLSFSEDDGIIIETEEEVW